MPAPPSSEQTTSLELQSVYDEIAALEAQYVALDGQSAAIPSSEPADELAVLSAEPPIASAIPSAETNFAIVPSPATPAPQEPLFDFTPPSTALATSEPFTPVSPGLTQSRQRHLIWGACVLSAMLLLLGGQWLYGQSDEAPALAAAGAEPSRAVSPSVNRRAIAAKEFTLGPDGEVLVKPIAQERPVASVPPPLVLLDAKASAEEKVDPVPLVPAEQKSPLASGEPKSVPAEVATARTLSTRVTRNQAPQATQSEEEGAKSGAVRPRVLAASSEPAKPSARDTTTAATLKACREHGYHAAQCAKRDCSITKYGFVCRG